MPASVYFPAMPERPRRPRDSSQLAKLVVDLATGTASVNAPERQKNPAAVALGKLGGQKGGRARAEKLTKSQRSKIARQAARARWGNKDV